ncbi:hypothetical protein SERLA73DRAFT_79072 [Serpula lacrymans var. lacrymans S7.3]|uniref:C2H2-type domain-containing protein n=2 Tax=Serpula lacrymans var. lacrymans TaxID=341189 RepID=F8QF71_SERL3|nr:uncharacterized protein SERLADRAFT_435634 [Serpula lacrymans var. lacrymans S7.9]EGN93030.1 hypothetical protein SERLA73DRAFT_79072 [Serpula lacrymans var. lacrymans S7.3]EGO27868.1 hypothetical protein SERLADRAFT_435634 [Serpula lacrymans var. lacrymans S7.9]
MPAFQAPPTGMPSRGSASHSCYWDWCRLTFPSSGQLTHHVIHDHVRKAKPMKKRDIIWMKKTDKSLSGSLDTTRSVVPRRPTNAQIGELNSTSLRPHSDQSHSTSLPYPSSSHPHNTGPPSPPTTHNSSSPPLMNHPSSPPSLNAHALTSKRPASVSASTPGHASFAQLSSPIGTPAIPSLPQSPALDFLVGRAIEQSRVPQVGLSEKLRSQKLIDSSNSLAGPSLLRPGSSRSPHTPLSRSSTSSQDVVERQLTQDSDMEVDRAEIMKEVDTADTSGPRPSSSGIDAQEDSEMDGSDLEWPGREDEGSISKPQPLASSQGIYGTPIPSHNQSPPIYPSSGGAIHAVSDTGSCSPPSIDFRSRFLLLNSSDKGSAFRSGALKITPNDSSTHVMQPTAENKTSMSHANTTSEENHLAKHSHVSSYPPECSEDVSSYPMVLLTQAPYQSQSQSQ